MKIDIVKKVGEITITELRSARDNRVIANEANRLLEEKKRIEEEKRRIAEEKKHRELLDRLDTIVPHIMRCINEAAKTGRKYLDFAWDTSKDSKSNGITWEEWKILKETFNSHFGSLGYRISDHEYSDSWKERSGKVGYG
jgi:hypothetical protein